MKKHLQLASLLLLGLISCNRAPSDQTMEQWKTEIIAMEKEFNDMAQKEGLVKAFEFYAAEDGVIRRSKKIIKGKNAIAAWCKEDVRPNEKLTWKPTFVEVSQSGDLAYTYGDFVFTYPDPDSTTIIKTNTGIFHTVWKRQANGDWRFVWD